MSKIAIFGTSGFAMEVADICIDLGYIDIVLISKELNEVSIESNYYKLITEHKLDCLIKNDYSFIIGIGDNCVREKIYNQYPDLRYTNLIHPTATFGLNQLKEFSNTKGNIITAGVRFTNRIKVGNFGIFNLNATIGHDVKINDFVNIAPGSNISGNVFLSKGVYIGTNAAIINGLSRNKKLCIGEDAIIGAGAVVTKDINDGVTVVGVPAREL